MSEAYTQRIRLELDDWCDQMIKPPSTSSHLASNFQERVNRLVPEKIHSVVTGAIREMTKGVIVGSQFMTFSKKKIRSLEETEIKVQERIKIYSSSAAAEGAVTGFGGILLGLADLPLWLSLKMKMLFEIASLYGFNTKELKERIYLLYIFELTFSSQNHKNLLFKKLNNWEEEVNNLPDDIKDFDWKTFQLQYRDHIDVRKLLQLIPGAGAVIGAYVNHSLTGKLGDNAKNAFRLRILKS